MNMEEEILKILSKKEMRVEELKEKIKDEKINLVLKEMEDSGLIFLKKNQSYSITLLGKILALGLKEVYEDIVEKKDLFDFFRTRIPSAIPDELLAKFKTCKDFQILGKPDLVDKYKGITNKAISMQPSAEKDMCISAPVVFKPSLLHAMAILKKKPRIRLILLGKEYETNKTLMDVSGKLINMEIKLIEEKYHYMGLQYVDDISCFFGFRDLDDKPGWDAIIYTENKECIEWVKENFDYMWDNLARKP